jgi:hypothetical protein
LFCCFFSSLCLSRLLCDVFSFEKDQITDASQKIRESQDAEKKVVELNEKLQQVREQVRWLLKSIFLNVDH